jgi:hypothetical protein
VLDGLPVAPLGGGTLRSMKLRTRLNLIVAGLTAMFITVLIFAEIQDSRSSINE